MWTDLLTSPAVLNTVRYSGYGCFAFSVHCAHTPAPVTSPPTPPIA